MPIKNPMPYVPGWSPLEVAEAELFPDTPPERLTKEDRARALLHAKALLAERTGVFIP